MKCVCACAFVGAAMVGTTSTEICPPLPPYIQVDVFLTRALAGKLFLLQVCWARLQYWGGGGGGGGGGGAIRPLGICWWMEQYSASGHSAVVEDV